MKDGKDRTDRLQGKVAICIKIRKNTKSPRFFGGLFVFDDRTQKYYRSTPFRHFPFNSAK